MGEVLAIATLIGGAVILMAISYEAITSSRVA